MSRSSYVGERFRFSRLFARVVGARGLIRLIFSLLGLRSSRQRREVDLLAAILFLYFFLLSLIRILSVRGVRGIVSLYILYGASSLSKEKSRNFAITRCQKARDE